MYIKMIQFIKMANLIRTKDKEAPGNPLPWKIETNKPEVNGRYLNCIM
jgi:hypothetical protein